MPRPPARLAPAGQPDPERPGPHRDHLGQPDSAQLHTGAGCLERLFRGEPQDYTRESLERQINNNLLTDDDARAAFGDLDWLVKSSAFLIARALYRIGCIGYWDSSQKRYIYSLEKSDLDQSLPSSTKLRVHGALTEYLELRPKRKQKTTKKASTAKPRKTTTGAKRGKS